MLPGNGLTAGNVPAALAFPRRSGLRKQAIDCAGPASRGYSIRRCAGDRAGRCRMRRRNRFPGWRNGTGFVLRGRGQSGTSVWALGTAPLPSRSAASRRHCCGVRPAMNRSRSRNWPRNYPLTPGKRLHGGKAATRHFPHVLPLYRFVPHRQTRNLISPRLSGLVRQMDLHLIFSCLIPNPFLCFRDDGVVTQIKIDEGGTVH